MAATSTRKWQRGPRLEAIRPRARGSFVGRRGTAPAAESARTQALKEKAKKILTKLGAETKKKILVEARLILRLTIIFGNNDGDDD